MQLPKRLQAAIEREVERIDLKALIRAREDLTRQYRQAGEEPDMASEAHRLAYLLTRMPATYAALAKALEAIRDIQDWNFLSLLDLGAGPGTALWAASEYFPSLQQATLIERDISLTTLGKRLAQEGDHPALKTAHWLYGDLEQMTEFPEHDLVVHSYSIGELKSDAVIPLMEQCWKATRKMLLVVEPGTPVGFERIRLVRSRLIDWGAHMVAPCPHTIACPMVGSDWCHFAARVERTSLHRKLKSGSLGFEDEKFSYVAVSKEPVLLATSRILSEPSRHSGHVNLKLCTRDDGLQFQTISKRHGEQYKQARKASWGDTFPS